MSDLKTLALKHAANELEKASNIVLMNSEKPDFGNATNRNTPAGEALALIRSAQHWIASVAEEIK